MRVEPVKIKDIDDIFNLERKTFKKNAFSKDMLSNLIQNNFYFFKLINNGKSRRILGFVIIIQDREDRLNLINFLIRKRKRKKGYGSFLLSFTLKKVIVIDKIKTIVLNVNSKNEAAIGLYQKFNFRIVQRIENYYRDKQSAYLMILNI